jgi:hypothetical protein
MVCDVSKYLYIVHSLTGLQYASSSTISGPSKETENSKQECQE